MAREREPLPTHVAATPGLPPGYGRALDDGLAALRLTLAPDARAAIDGHIRLLLAWNAAINLTAIRDPVAAATLHVVDSLAGLASLDDRAIDHCLDLGSGGGFPGIPLAAARPDWTVTLLEPTGKKARFLETAVAAIGLSDRVRVTCARAEALAASDRDRGRWPVVTARAVAAMADLVELAFPLLAPGGRVVAWKRGALDAELAAARRAMAALGGGVLEIRELAVAGLDGHRLVIATRTGAVPEAYPRDPAARSRRPW